MIGIGNHFFHPLHIPGFRLEQSTHIMLRGRLNGPRPLAKMTPEALTECYEALTYPGQQPHVSVSRGVFLGISIDVSFIRYLIKPCLFTKLYYLYLSIIIKYINLTK
jgi:hypothetical protein